MYPLLWRPGPWLLGDAVDSRRPSLRLACMDRRADQLSNLSRFTDISLTILCATPEDKTTARIPLALSAAIYQETMTAGVKTRRSARPFVDPALEHSVAISPSH